VVREANLALLKSLTPQQWKHYGMHSERGQETIELIVRMYAGHDINHLQQIERILSSERDVGGAAQPAALSVCSDRDSGSARR